VFLAGILLFSFLGTLQYLFEQHKKRPTHAYVCQPLQHSPLKCLCNLSIEINIPNHAFVVRYVP
jgi:hypothetical protein